MNPPSHSSIDASVRYLYEVGQLKLSKRTGWWHAGVPEPESIAEHTFRTAIIGYVLAVLEDADPNLTAALCLFHDVAEARTGDVPNVAKAYVTREPGVRIAADQVHEVPPALRDAIMGAVGRFADQDSPEALLAKDADRLECLLQARIALDAGPHAAQNCAIPGPSVTILGSSVTLPGSVNASGPW